MAAQKVAEERRVSSCGTE